MKIKPLFIIAVLVVMLVSSVSPALAGKDDKVMHINVLLNTDITDDILTELGQYGQVKGKLIEIDSLIMKIKESDLESILALPYVTAANPDAERGIGPQPKVEVSDFSDGLSTWNLDVINVTDFGFNNRQVDFNGTGVYVAVLDTGLVKNWQYYFPEGRIATEYAKSFGGGGGEHGYVPEQPNKWERDTNSHGTHVTSTIIGYDMRGTSVNGVAPLATVIPVKVLNQNGSGWSYTIAEGIMYVASLKEGPLSDSPVIINMSLGGPELDAVEKAAIDYAIDAGVIIVASAGNEGLDGMGYPGAYEPVISVAASGFVGEWVAGGWWYLVDDPEPNNPLYYYITDFSSRELEGQDLDVAAPGSWVVGPYQVDMGHLSYYYLGGTSMASPHVAGVVALLAQKDPSLSASAADSILTSTATYLGPGCRDVYTPAGTSVNYCWGDDATGAGVINAFDALQ